MRMKITTESPASMNLDRLDAPLSPGCSPLLKPSREALVTPVVALVGGVVVMNLDLGVSRVPKQLARRDQVPQHSLSKLHILLRHRLRRQAGREEGLAAVLMLEHVDHLAVAQLETRVGANVELGSAVPISMFPRDIANPLGPRL
jgi:hypothetical protein